MNNGDVQTRASPCICRRMTPHQRVLTDPAPIVAVGHGHRRTSRHCNSALERPRFPASSPPMSPPCPSHVWPSTSWPPQEETAGAGDVGEQMSPRWTRAADASCIRSSAAAGACSLTVRAAAAPRRRAGAADNVVHDRILAAEAHGLQPRPAPGDMTRTTMGGGTAIGKPSTSTLVKSNSWPPRRTTVSRRRRLADTGCRRRARGAARPAVGPREASAAWRRSFKRRPRPRVALASVAEGQVVPIVTSSPSCVLVHKPDRSRASTDLTSPPLLCAPGYALRLARVSLLVSASAAARDVRGTRRDPRLKIVSPRRR